MLLPTPTMVVIQRDRHAFDPFAVPAVRPAARARGMRGGRKRGLQPWSYLSRICRHLLPGPVFTAVAVLLLLFSLPSVTAAGQITLAWDANEESSLAGYRVYYGTRSRAYDAAMHVGRQTSCVVAGLENGRTYFFAATAVDSYGLESDYSNEVAVSFDAGGTPSAPGSAGAATPADGQETTTATEPGGSGPQTPGSTPDAAGLSGGTGLVPASSSGGGGGGGGCFIATAAYGSYVDPHVMILRSFRDTYLLTNDVGRAFVRWYYAVSPSVADTIRQRPLLKALVRILLLPAILFSYLSLLTGPFPALTILLLGCCALLRATRCCRPSSTRRAPPGEE